MITVAIDTSPLFGHRTGVGRAVEGIVDSLHRHREEIEVLPYVVSLRARIPTGTRRLPYPAASAIAAWGHWNHPRPDRHLRPAEIVHGTNYIVPPSRNPRVVSVYDCWALRHPEHVAPAVTTAMGVLKRNISSGAVVHVPSQATRDAVVELFPRAHVHLAPLGAPRQPISNAETTTLQSSRTLPDGVREPYVLCVGTVEFRKNVPRLIDAFARSDLGLDNVGLVIAGAPGDDEEQVRSTIDSLDPATRNRIIRLGPVDPHTLDEVYRCARIVAYPSLDEGFGFPILEAMAYRVPVIAANRGSIPEIAGPAARLVDPLDVDDMANALEACVRDEVLRQRLIDDGITRCSAFRWETTARSLIDLYTDLMSDHVHRGPRAKE